MALPVNTLSVHFIDKTGHKAFLKFGGGTYKDKAHSGNYWSIRY